MGEQPCGRRRRDSWETAFPTVILCCSASMSWKAFQDCSYMPIVRSASPTARVSSSPTSFPSQSCDNNKTDCGLGIFNPWTCRCDCPIPHYKMGTTVIYVDDYGVQKCTVIAVTDTDDCMEPYYTVQFPDGKEKQTDNDHLTLTSQRMK